MNTPESTEHEQVYPGLRPLRVWIPVLLLGLMLLARNLPGLVEDGPSGMWMFAAFGPVLLSFVIIGWWLFLSRASGKEKLIGMLGIVTTAGITISLLHPSMLGVAVIVMTLPVGIAAFAVAIIALHRWLTRKRTVVAVLVAGLGFGSSALFQSDGVWGNFALGLDWRWNTTAEEELLASKKLSMESALPEDLSTLDDDLDGAEWPGFRGPRRDGVWNGPVPALNWETEGPRELWRVPVGPAWSSFAVAGSLLFTQEQRGEEEVVACYDAETGRENWVSAVESRFFEALGGLGPRATPVLANRKVYSLGAEGWLQCHSAKNGDRLWQVDIKQTAKLDVPPMWGFSCSPIVSNDLVIIHAGGKDDFGVLAFNAEDGSLKWSVSAGRDSYASIHSVEVAGRPLLALLTNTGAQFMHPDDGTIVLDYSWPHQGYRALQPAMLDNDRMLIPTGMGSGTRLVQLAFDGDRLTAEEVWTSRFLKPDYNDILVSDNAIYGFDNSIFTCISLDDGDRLWKKGRYGKGQALLLSDPGLLIVASESGELVLLEASPEQHRELGRVAAMDGKTWNHPVVVGNRLYVRNAEEAICYELYPEISSESETESLN